MLPQFMIIGAQKSATTYLQQLLETHPQIFLAPGEVAFFEDPTYPNSNLSALERLFDRAPPGTARGLKRPNYLGKEECPARIAHDIPDAKFILVLRDPVSRFVSAYFHYMRGNVIPCGDMNQGIKNLLDGNYASIKPRAEEILNFGLYAKHLSRYFEYFPREAFYITEQKHFLENWESAMAEVCAFLGVDNAFKFQKPLHVGNKGVYALPRVRLRQMASALSTHWFGDLSPTEVIVAKAKNSVATALKLVDRAILVHLFDNETPLLDDENRARLNNFYQQDRKELAELLGGKFARW